MYKIQKDKTYKASCSSKTSFSQKNCWKELELSIKSFSWEKTFFAIESLVAIVAS